MILCEYVGCNEHNNLKNLYSSHWCNDHGRIITSLRLTVLNKSNTYSMLMNKLKEFSYRKVLNIDLVNEILDIEGILNIDTESSFNMKVNLVHYKYSNMNNVSKDTGNFTYFSESNSDFFKNLFGKRR